MPQWKSMGQKYFDAACNSGPASKKTELEGAKQMIRGTQYLPKESLDKQDLFS